MRGKKGIEWYYLTGLIIGLILLTVLFLWVGRGNLASGGLIDKFGRLFG